MRTGFYGSVPLYVASGSAGGDVASGVVATVGTGASSVAGMLTAAGAMSAIPVAGWAAAGVTAAAAGLVSLVSGIAKGKMRRADAVAAAKSLGLPDPDEVPGFVVKALKWDEYKVQRKLNGMKNAKTRKGKAKKALLEAILVHQRQARVARIRAEVQPVAAAPPASASPPAYLLPLAFVGVGVMGVLWWTVRARK